MTSGETRILLLRHGETAEPSLFHGAESDVGLSATGLEQAERVARWLEGERPAAVYSSAMRRARDTAARIAEACRLPLTTVDALHERRMGALSGRDRQQGWPDYVAARDRWVVGDLEATHVGGESYREVRARVVPQFEAIARAHAARTCVVVAHGVVIRVAATTLLDGMSPADWDAIGIDFVAVHDLRTDGSRWWHAGLNRDVVGAATPRDPFRG